MLKCVCENKGLRKLVKWIYEQNQVIIVRKFVNLNILRSILIDLVMNIANNHWKMFIKTSQESLKFLLYSVILVTTVLQMVLIIENTVNKFFIIMSTTTLSPQPKRHCPQCLKVER